jgi:hypothetical protein
MSEAFCARGRSCQSATALGLTRTHAPCHGRRYRGQGWPIVDIYSNATVEIIPDIRLQLSWLFRLRRTGLCGHDACDLARAHIQGYSRNDFLLYPGISNALSTEGMDGETVDLEGIHVVVHLMVPPGDVFTLITLNTMYGRLPQPEGMELWSNIGSVKSEVARLADVS